MTTDRPTLADRLSHLSPHQREQAGATVILCELVDELVIATTRQNILLQRALITRAADDNAGQTRGAGHPAGAAAPSGPAEGDDQGGAQVQLREPGLPPADPDPEPAPAKRGADRAVAEPTAAPTPARRKPAVKAAAAAKTTPPAKAARQGRQQ